MKKCSNQAQEIYQVRAFYDPTWSEFSHFCMVCYFLKMLEEIEEKAPMHLTKLQIIINSSTCVFSCLLQLSGRYAFYLIKNPQRG